MCVVHVAEALAKACGVAKSRERYVTPRAHTPEVMACALLPLHVDPSEIARVFANSTLSGLKGGTGGGEGCGGDGGGGEGGEGGAEGGGGEGGGGDGGGGDGGGGAGDGGGGDGDGGGGDGDGGGGLGGCDGGGGLGGCDGGDDGGEEGGNIPTNSSMALRRSFWRS